MDTNGFDAILVGSFGGPEGMDDVMPFLRNVLRGRNVPEARMIEVSHHYEQFGGVSPINEQNREFIAALEVELAKRGVDLPVYFGNRNWEPFFGDVIEEMKGKGQKKVLTWLTSAFSCYSGCRQYRENITEAAEKISFEDFQSHKIRVFYNHPKFIEVQTLRAQDALNELPEELRDDAHFVFTAHSIPISMAQGARYEAQLNEASRLVAEAMDREKFSLVYQSRSGAPHVPWLEPDVCDYIEELKGKDEKAVVIIPIGFVSDHMEVLFDLDTEAREACEENGIAFARAKAPGAHPVYIDMAADLIIERMTGSVQKPSLGTHGPSHDVCPVSCCPSGRPAGGGRPPVAAAGGRPTS